MGYVQGLSSVHLMDGRTQAPNGNPAATMDGSSGRMVINGTPVRIVVLALSAAVGLTVLKLAGFRFNVGVSS